MTAGDHCRSGELGTIGIISDTHGLLRDEALERLHGADHIIHAGDIGGPDIIAKLEAIAPVTVVRGNVDVSGWASRFPETARLCIFGRSIFVIHDRKLLDMDPAAEGVDVVISGHSHRPGIETANGTLYLNPGSAGPRRFRLPVTLATIEVIGDALFPHIHRIA